MTQAQDSKIQDSKTQSSKTQATRKKPTRAPSPKTGHASAPASSRSGFGADDVKALSAPYLALMRQWREASLFWPTTLTANLNDPAWSQTAFKAIADRNMDIWGRAARASGFAADPDSASPIVRMMTLWQNAMPKISFYKESETPKPRKTENDDSLVA